MLRALFVLAIALAGMVACGIASAAYTPFTGVWTVDPVDSSGGIVYCNAGVTEPNNQDCGVGSYDGTQDPAVDCGGSGQCFYWPSTDGAMPDLEPPGGSDPEGITAAEAVELCWAVLGVWAVAFTCRMLAWAARPS